MKRILITGGAGFIGYHLAISLLKYNYQIDLLDNYARGVRDIHLDKLGVEDRINFINADLLDSRLIDKVESDYSYIYHLAAVIGVQHVLKSPYSVLNKNHLMLQNTLNIANNQKNLERFVFTSTSEIYAGTLQHYGLEFPTPELTPITITDLTEPRTSYMLSKIYGECMCLHSELPVTIVRPHNFYGPRMGLSHVIPELMKKCVDSKTGTLSVFSINHKRTFCYISDAVEMIRLLAESDLSIGNAFNIGNDDEEISMGDLAKKIIKVTKKDLEIKPLPSTAGSPDRRCPSLNKLKGKINYFKKYSLDMGLEETYNWYSCNVFHGKGISAL